MTRLCQSLGKRRKEAAGERGRKGEKKRGRNEGKGGVGGEGDGEVPTIAPDCTSGSCVTCSELELLFLNFPCMSHADSQAITGS